MYQHLEDKDYKHLICIVVGGSEDEETIHGLAHVGEHMLLLPCFDEDDADESYIASGYTCIDHIFMYFASRNESSLKKIKDKIEDRSIIRADRVEIAKHQVIWECENLKDEIASNEEKVRFITDNRITNFAAGKVEDIKEITAQNISEWLDGIINEKRMFFFSLEEYSYASLQNVCAKHYPSQCKPKQQETVHLLYMNSQKQISYKVEIYVPLSLSCEKEKYFWQLLDEQYIKNYLCKFTEQIDVSEKFFSYTERYLLISIENALPDWIPEIVRELRNSADWGKDSSYENEKEKFRYQLMMAQDDGESSNMDIIYAVINELVFDIPFIDIEKDIDLLESIGNHLSAEIQESLKKNMKIVIS